MSLWERGMVDDAVSAYFHMDKTTTKQMEDGKKLHELIATHIQAYNSFPDFFFKYPLKIPEVEKEVVVSYNELFDLKAFFDCYDGTQELLFEYKTGVQDSLTWARTYQIPLYFLIAELAGIKVSSAFLVRHNQYKKETDFVIVHNTPDKVEMARNYVDSIGPEIYAYFKQEGFI